MKAIETLEEYMIVMKRFAQIMENEQIGLSKREENELDELSKRIEKYELKRYPIEEASDERD